VCILQVLLILQYSYLTAARCLCIPGDATSSSSDSSGGGSTGCVWVLNSDPTVTRHVFELLGLHRTSAGVLPLFLIYLAVLMYNYQLSTAPWKNIAALGAAQPAEAAHLGAGNSAGVDRQAANPAVSDRPPDGPSTASPRPEVDRSRAAAAGGAMLLMIALQGWAGQLWILSRLLLHKLAYHVRWADVATASISLGQMHAAMHAMHAKLPMHCQWKLQCICSWALITEVMLACSRLAECHPQFTELTVSCIIAAVFVSWKQVCCFAP